MKNKNFKELIDDYSKLGLITLDSKNSLAKVYSIANEEQKVRFDKYAQIVLDDFISRNNSNSMEIKHLDSIRKNVQFFAWLTIVSLVGYAIVALVIATNS